MLQTVLQCCSFQSCARLLCLKPKPLRPPLGKVSLAEQGPPLSVCGWLPRYAGQGTAAAYSMSTPDWGRPTSSYLSIDCSLFHFCLHSRGLAVAPAPLMSADLCDLHCRSLDALHGGSSRCSYCVVLVLCLSTTPAVWQQPVADRDRRHTSGLSLQVFERPWPTLRQSAFGLDKCGTHG